MNTPTSILILSFLALIFLTTPTNAIGGCETFNCPRGQTCIVAGRGVPMCVAADNCSCTKELKPVCCRYPNGITEKTDNACVCRCGGGWTVNNEQCPTPTCSSCSSLYDPVCCLNKRGRIIRATSICRCECRGGTVKNSGCTK